MKKKADIYHTNAHILGMAEHQNPLISQLVNKYNHGAFMLIFRIFGGRLASSLRPRRGHASTCVRGCKKGARGGHI